ncbi:sensor histidine kinase [Tautonia sociabilis]|uniref:histidine kinase n=1 Tax=Tautonia sociabilis TaxID=2080755 RepID=A0A432MFF4_9BACT|nr:heavy metal sensor histidine kinase [Tautonia sociabilis]RUL84924.1 HAMP domain-containing protein [Tautonia sociabilis]
MPSASIRVRLTAWYGAVLMVTVVGLGTATYLLLASSLRERVDATLDFEFEEARERLESGHPPGELAGAPAAFHESFLLRVLGPGGRALAESPRLAGLPLPVPATGAGAGPSAHFDATLGPIGRCRVVSGRVGPAPGRWTVLIATPLESYFRELEELRGALLTILPAGLAAATIGGYWLAGRSLAPVQRMTEAARRISAENLGERLAPAGPGDELDLLAETLNAMLDRIDQAFAATRRFTADAAHELRTPLAAIRTEAEVALLAPRPPEEYREALRSVVEEADRLSRLADRLLLLSREDAGRALDRRPVRLDEAVREAAEAAAVAAGRAGVSLRVGPLCPAEVAGDPDLIRQVFDNLLDNAVKYTPAGGEVAVTARREGGRAVIEVRDTGVGIAGDALPRIFDRFYRADPSRSRRTGGTGLGLSIARAVVERHEGTIGVESDPGVGSTFRVAIPARFVEDPGGRSRAESVSGSIRKN